ncbi:non-ribosomal peptide synthetase [Ruegeria sp. HKCCA5426]|uniref:non-ribosomal peptide synthetase n=1 Tax=Ruegeria sp. HKCCA5426 TaxID=2682985 RepID=UPI0014898454|nr:non-ribosomal peptide synthetase [Ruegeria sp. HKCCA5426]
MSYPLTESQTLFWKGHQLQPDVPLYNMAWRFDLHFAVQPEVFKAAFLETLELNQALRTAIRDTPEGPVQFAVEMDEDLLEIKDLSDNENQQETLTSESADWVQTPFELIEGTMRSRLVKLANSHWVWLVCQHHIACDAQSGALMFEQVSQRYERLQGGHTEKVESLPNFFERQNLRSSSMVAAHVAAPTAKTPPYGSDPQRTFSSKRLRIPVDPALFGALENAIAKPEFRLFTPELSRLAIYLTAFFAHLHRITGDEEITIGLPSHNRLTPDDRRTIGLFVEVLPLSIQFDASDTLLDLHGKVKKGLGVFLKQAKPGAVSKIDTSGVSAVCNYIQARFDAFAGHPASVEWLHSGAHDAIHSLRLHVIDFEGSGVPSLSLDVQNKILESVSETSLCAHFVKFLTAMVSTPESRVTAVAFSAGPEDLSLVQGPAEPQSTQVSVLERFRSHVRNTPDLIALSQAEHELSYGQLDEFSDHIATHLKELGVSRGSCVAVHLPRSMDFVIAVMGVLKAGCAFVPIATNIPPARVDEILLGSRASAVFVTPEDQRKYPYKSITVEAARHDDTVVRGAIEPDDTAYVLFTSGSTGVPKGVEVNHENLTRYIDWAARCFANDRPAHFAFFSSVSFDLTLTSLFVPLITGGSIRVYPESSDPDLAILDVFAEDKVDIVKLTPSHLALACTQTQFVRRIETLILGGENLTSALCRRALNTLSPSLKIINEYGPTEAVVGAMHHRFDPDADTQSSVQIGQPAVGVTLSVRDAALNICPLGVTGEILISGRLADGYLNSPSLTAEKFVDDPLNLQDKLYRTGDLGRITNDGRFEYLGRADQQIKKNGVRFETAEYEQILRHLPDVDAVHVTFSSTDHTIVSTQQCKNCGLTDAVPGVHFDTQDMCTICAEFYTYKDRAGAYFRAEPELEDKIAQAVRASTGKYDVLMMLSGGKDSTYAAYRLAAYGPRVLAVTLDNGYISDEAKENIQRVVDDLNWDHRYLSTDKMNQIFVDSLKTHSNVCQGCFKALYTLAFRTALSEGAAMVVTGLSRGQFFETRLTPDLFRHSAPNCAQLDDMVTQARKTYHAEDDAVSRLLQTDDLKDGRFLSQIDVLDIYRYVDVPVSDIYEFLDIQTAWKRPRDTGRSTNCLINDAGIHVHKTREGFHNYALPYSWDVRMGHKTRDQALDELNDEIDTQRIEAILEEIGFDEPVTRAPALTVYVAGHDLNGSQVWDILREHLQREMLPDQVVILDEMPLNANGKVDTSKLPKAASKNPPPGNYVAPETETQRRLAAILSGVLGEKDISATRDFFDLGVDSIAAIEVAMKANEQGINLPATALFEYRSLRALASYADTLPNDHGSGDDDAHLIDLDDDYLSRITEALD